MGVCRELGMTLKEGMEMSVFEIKCWAAFFKIDGEKQRESMNKLKTRK
jgi:hypothetical protein